MEKVKASGEGSLRSADKVLLVLRAFLAGEPRQTADSISRNAGLPLSSTYRYLGVLRQSGFIEDGGNDTFRIAAMVIGLARAAYGALGLTEVARPYMEQLSRDSGETVLLFTRSGDRAVCVDRFESPARVRFAFDIGTALPLHQGAAPKLLLANAPDSEQSKIIDDAVSRDSALLENMDSFRAELAQIRAQGWAETSGEITEDVYAVAAAVKSRRRVIATISIAGLAYRIADEDHVRLREMVKNVAQKLSKAYGSTQPPM